jgi:energy-coupling factor transporter ATP-binding protein EcfA2
MNDQFGGNDPWDGFLVLIESKSPAVRALGITDYYGIEGYKQVVKHKTAGRLPGVGFIFPNIEMRLAVGTTAGTGVNFHLLIDPRDPKHIEHIERFLQGFTFTHNGTPYRCSRADLIALGKDHDPKIVNEHKALEAGANQFKVEWGKFKQQWEGNKWIQENALIAVAVRETDGVSGLRDATDSFAALRAEIQRATHIMFTASPKEIEFWCGKGKESLESVREKWSGPKPCLHGSDAHKGDRVLAPDLDRFSWVKGDLTFEALRQAALDPEDRVLIGPEAPQDALKGQCIETVSVTEAPWLSPSSVPLNSGLVAIIGARGSGKTALADFIAAGAYALSDQLDGKSFIQRARNYLVDSDVTLKWSHGDSSGMQLKAVEHEDLIDSPRVQYLSQQFVEKLCAADGLTDDLVAEIERVVFDSHDVEERLGAENFKELLEARLEQSRRTRARESDAVAQISVQIATERQAKEGKAPLEKEHAEKLRSLAMDRKDRDVLVPKGDAERTKRLLELTQAVERRRQAVAKVKRRLASLKGLESEVKGFRSRKASPMWYELKREHVDAQLTEPEWSLFKVDFQGQVDTTLATKISAADKDLGSLQGVAIQGALGSAPDDQMPLIGADKPLDDQTLAVLQQEQARLQRLVGIDGERANRLQALSTKISATEVALGKLEAQIEYAKGADVRIAELQSQRIDAYKGIFRAIVAEQAELEDLYKPLKGKILSSTGSLKNLALSVDRTVDVGKWAVIGEKLLDLRAAGTFQGRGVLEKVATEELLSAWKSGDESVAAEAIRRFLERHADSLLKQRLATVDRNEWLGRFVQWLFSTDHIRVTYGLRYDSAEIGILSPGTRGIVLLMLYLALDVDDSRPLVIDQPEENLDPMSVYTELVPRFREARKRRQIIMITHNANLVVNTDADQVIVAKAEAQASGQLPRISYVAGALENQEIRDHVCGILEGGEQAFRDRAKRLRLKL